MRPKTDRFPSGFVIEFKSIKRGEAAGMDVEIKKAMQQIEEKKYVTDLQEAGVSTVYRIALVLKGKDIRVSVES